MTTHYSSIWIINMHYLLYSMSELWNNTQIIDPQKWNKFHTHITTHIGTLACHTRSRKYAFYMLIAKLLASQPIFYAFWKIKMIILTFLPLPLLHFSIIWNAQTKTKYFHFRNFDWLMKITHIVDGGAYLKTPKLLIDISILVLFL